MKTAIRRVTLALIFGIISISAPLGLADGIWQDLETGIAVQFHQVNAQNCTWDFKNTTASKTLQSMTFSYTHTAPTPGGVYNPYDTKTDKDILPYPLKAGQVVGGWAAFIAPGSCNRVTINVINREWK